MFASFGSLVCCLFVYLSILFSSSDSRLFYWPKMDLLFYLISQEGSDNIWTINLMGFGFNHHIKVFVSFLILFTFLRLTSHSPQFKFWLSGEGFPMWIMWSLLRFINNKYFCSNFVSFFFLRFTSHATTKKKWCQMSLSVNFALSCLYCRVLSDKLYIHV